MIRGRSSWIERHELLGQRSSSSFPLQVPLVALLAYSYENISPWSVVLFAIPAFAAHRLLLLYRQQMETAEALGEANSRLEGANLSFATALVRSSMRQDGVLSGWPLSRRSRCTASDMAERDGLRRLADRTAITSSLAGSRHRQDRASGRSPREARRSNVGRAEADGTALDDRRADPQERRTTPQIAAIREEASRLGLVDRLVGARSVDDVTSHSTIRNA